MNSSVRQFGMKVGWATVLLAGGLRGQAPLVPAGSPARIQASDLAVLEEQDVRKELPCTVTPDKPELGFDLRFHAGYEVNVPLRELAGLENQLTILFRVTSEKHKDEPAYFVQRFQVPSIDDDARGQATLSGNFDVGAGSYHVDWLMRDRAERVCSYYWDAEASLNQKDKQIGLTLPAAAVEPVEPEQFRDEPPVERSASPELRIKVLLNFAPQNWDAAAFRSTDTLALVSILRQLSREPRLSGFSLVAFNMQEQRVVYRQKSEEKIDFPSLGEAIRSIKLGTVDRKLLIQKHGETEFLTDLIQKEMKSDDHPDALVFAGPKVMLDEAVPEETLKPLADVDYPVFYMNYALNPAAIPWHDSISRAVKVFKGTEYTISRPRDLWFAVSDMVTRIVKSKHGQVAATVSPR